MRKIVLVDEQIVAIVVEELKNGYSTCYMCNDDKTAKAIKRTLKFYMTEQEYKAWRSEYKVFSDFGDE